MNKLPRLGATLAGGALVLGSLAVQAQTTFDWTGGPDGTGWYLFFSGGYENWEPNLTAPDVASGSSNHFIIAERNFGGPDARISDGEGRLAMGVTAYIGSLTFSDPKGHLPDNLIITASGGSTARQLHFTVPNTTIITLDDSVTGTVTIGHDRANYGNFGIRIPDNGISTIHVAHPDAVLDLSPLWDWNSGRGGIHSGTTTLTDDRGYLRKTGDGTLDLRTPDGQGNRVKGLIVEGGTVIVSGNSQMAWAQDTFQADHVVINGGTLHMQGFTTNSGTTRGFQVGENGGTFLITDTNIGINGVVSDVPGQEGILIKTGTHALRLIGENTYSGGTHIMEGRLRYTSSTALGTGRVTMHDNSELAQMTSTDSVLANDFDIVGNTVQFGGDSQVVTLTGDIDLTGGSRTFVIADTTNLLGTVSNGSLSTIRGLTNDVELNLNGLNTFTGTTTVESGRLYVNGSIPGGVVANRGMATESDEVGSIGGSGTIGGHVMVYGELRPGPSSELAFGTLGIGGDLSLFVGSEAIFAIGSITDYNRVSIGGDALLDGELTVLLSGGYMPSGGESFTLVDATGELALGANFSLNLPALDGGLFWVTDDFASVGAIAVIPEPSTVALLSGGSALLALIGLRRRRRG